MADTVNHYHPRSVTPDRVEVAFQMLRYYEQIDNPRTIRVEPYDSMELHERTGRKLRIPEVDVTVASLKLIREYIAGEYVEQSDQPEWENGLPGKSGWYLFLDGDSGDLHFCEVELDEDRLHFRFVGMPQRSTQLRGCHLPIPQPPFVIGGVMPANPESDELPEV